MTKANRETYKSSFLRHLYPGNTTLQITQEVINILTSENPSNTIKAKLTIDEVTGMVCESPWIEPTIQLEDRHICIAKFNKTTANGDPCSTIGGQTLFFSNQSNGLDGYSLSFEVREGKSSN